MATPIIMPRQGQSVETCIITEWHKKKGDSVEIGDVLFSYETDKASFEEEAKAAGTLLEIFYEADEEVPVLTTVAVIGEVGEDISEFLPSTTVTEETTPPPAAESTEIADTPIEPTPASQGQPRTSSEIRISPRARNLAKKHKLDYRYATPTGPEGRIIERDIQSLLEAGPKVTSAAMADYFASDQPLTGTGLGGRITTSDLRQPLPPANTVPTQTSSIPDYVDVKLPNIRKVIAKAMHHSLSSTAQLTLNTSFDATEILAYRQKLKAKQNELGLENITLNDLIIYATARTLLKHNELNAHYLDDTLRVFNNVHMGVAVDTERGLMVPTVFYADLLSLNQLAENTKRAIAACQAGSINPDELQGGTFTITNLGTLGIESFTPVLNPPQTGILGVCNIEYKIKLVDGEYVHYPAMGLSLTFDHRALDGAPAARFLKDLVTNLENFSVLLAM